MSENGATSISELIVMLTYNDETVANALDLFWSCRDLGVRHWGFKDVGLPPDQMRELGREMKAAGATVYLEIVSLTLEEALEAVEVAASCECDVVMGSRYSPEVHEALRAHGLRYFPFIGKTSSHPTVLSGTVEAIVEEARAVQRAGVDGIDLLTFRYVGYQEALLEAVAAATTLSVVSAGSIESFDRIRSVWDAGAWGFTIGSAFFDGVFDQGGSFRSNLEQVWSWLASEQAKMGTTAPNGQTRALDES